MRTHTKSIAILFTLLCAAVHLALATGAESLVNRMPDQTFFFAATSGADALAEPFAQTHLGLICADNQVRQFADSIIRQLTAKADVPEDAKVLQQALPLAKALIRRPILIGGLPSPAGAEPDVAFYALIEAGQAKTEIDPLIEGLFTDRELQPHTRLMGSLSVRVLPLDGETDLYWGWQDTLLVVAVNDSDGRVIRGLRPASYRRPQELDGVSERGDALVFWADAPRLLALAKTSLDAENPDAWANVQTVLSQLGLANVGRLIARAGFEEKNIRSESLIEIPAPHTGLLAAPYALDPALLCLADPKAFDATAVAIRLDYLYDTLLSTIRAAAPDEYPEIETQIRQTEQQLGFLFKQDFLASFTGSCLVYTLPPWSNPEIPTGGAVAIAQLKSPESLNKCFAALLTLAQEQAPADQLQIQSRDINGTEAQIIMNPALSMMQIMPCWTIAGNHLVVATHPSLAASALTRLAAAQPADSFCAHPQYPQMQSRFPANPFFLSCVDTSTQLRQALTQIQQFWPMLSMAASKEGIRLPMMLPNLDAYIKNLPPAVNYSVLTARGLESVYVGPGLQSKPEVGVAGGAMGLAILMPALNKTKQVAQRTVSATNLREIGLTALFYSQDNDGQFPPDLQTLITSYDLSPESLESPYNKTGEVPGPDYYYVEGQSDQSPPTGVLAFDNPRLVETDKINILYIDGHVAPESPADFEQAVKSTYENLNRPLPDDLADYFEENAAAETIP